MKRGISCSWDLDYHDKSVVVVEKKRGKLTLDEIEDALRTYECGMFCGNYVIMLRCGEATCGGSGWDIYDEPKGDTVTLYPADSEEACPVCSKLVPPYQYCPECGSSWDDEGEAGARRATVENLLDAMREEAEHRTGDGDLTAYWQYFGAVKMAEHIGYINAKKSAELIAKAETFKPKTDF